MHHSSTLIHKSGSFVTKLWEEKNIPISMQERKELIRLFIYILKISRCCCRGLGGVGEKEIKKKIAQMLLIPNRRRIISTLIFCQIFIAILDFYPAVVEI